MTCHLINKGVMKQNCIEVLLLLTREHGRDGDFQGGGANVRSRATGHRLMGKSERVPGNGIGREVAISCMSTD